MFVKQVVNCAFSSWYSKFKHITWESEIIPLSNEFVEYLKADGLVLPDNSNFEQSSGCKEDDDTDWDDPDPGLLAPEFPELCREIRAGINKLGSVFPKLNWSSAKDASWISLNNSMKCVEPNDIFLMLKSSEFITHDLTQPFKDCDIEANEVVPVIQYELVLRKWIDINPAMEFRCFVKYNNLVGVSQRDITNLYVLLGQEIDEILEDIKLFFQNKIRNRFFDDEYVFDVYRQSKHNVVLIDFNPFGKTTDALLFDWESLSSLTKDDNDTPEFRFIRDSVGILPNPYRNPVPQDFVDLGSGMDALKLIDLLNLSAQSTQGRQSNGRLNADSTL